MAKEFPPRKVGPCNNHHLPSDQQNNFQIKLICIYLMATLLGSCTKSCCCSLSIRTSSIKMPRLLTDQTGTRFTLLIRVRRSRQWRRRRWWLENRCRILPVSLIPSVRIPILLWGAPLLWLACPCVSRGPFLFLIFLQSTGQVFVRHIP